MTDKVEPAAMRPAIRAHIRAVPGQGPRDQRRQAGHHAQQAGFAAAIRTNENQRAALLQGEVEAAEYETLATLAGELPPGKAGSWGGGWSFEGIGHGGRRDCAASASAKKACLKKGAAKKKAASVGGTEAA